MKSVQEQAQEQLDAIMKNTAKTFINSRKGFITEFLEEIEEQDYTTMAQVRGALYKNLEILERVEND